VLLLKRRTPFEFWQSVTGSMEAGESRQDAARRELHEETGLGSEGVLSEPGRSRIFTIDPRWLDRYSSGVTENTEYEWRFRLASELDIKIDENEHTVHRWASVDEAIDLVWSWTNKEALQELKRELRQNILTV
jgi:dATP pyrophosphohydrolase